MFRKLNFILMSALVLGFTACDDIDDAIPQAYSPEPVMSLDGLEVEKGAALSQSTIDLNEVEQLEVITTVATPELREGQSVEYVMQVASSNEFTDTKSIETTEGCVYASELNTVFRELLGKTDKAKDLHVRFAAYLSYGDGARVRFGEQDTYFANAVINVIPFTPELFIDEVYYLVINGEVRAELSCTGGDVYDNPNFKASVDITEADFDPETFVCAWSVIAGTYKESNDASVARMVFGPAANDLEAASGALVANTGADDIPESGSLTMFGSLVFKVNVETLEFSISEAPAYLYTPGNSNGWNASASQVLYSSDKINYMGMAHLNGQYKFADTTDWSGKNYGSTDTEGKLTDDGGAGNLEASVDGLYWCNVNIDALTYSNTYISSFSAIGSFNGWSADAEMTPSEDFLVWTADVTFSAGDEFKFRVNNNWDIDFGGSTDDLTYKGSNITAPGEGTYTVVVDFSTLPYTVTLTKK